MLYSLNVHLGYKLIGFFFQSGDLLFISKVGAPQTQFSLNPFRLRRMFFSATLLLLLVVKTGVPGVKTTARM